MATIFAFCFVVAIVISIYRGFNNSQSNFYDKYNECKRKFIQYYKGI